MAKVDNEDKCIESENLNSRMADRSGDMDYKLQNSVNKFKDEDQFEEEHSFEKSHEEEALAVEKEEAEIGLAEWVKNIKPTSCPYVERESERSGSMEIAMLDGRLPRMANILFFQPEVVDGWMEVAEAGKKMVSRNNYCPHPRNIIAQNYRLLEDYFP